MPKITEAQARMLLRRPLRCEGDVAWKPQRHGRQGRVLSVGLVDGIGAATAMVVELRYTHNARAGKTRYLFSVFLRHRYGPERVYQLEVTQASRDSKNMHGKSHEHIGDLRSIGPALWQHGAIMKCWRTFVPRQILLSTPYRQVRNSLNVRGNHGLRSDFKSDRLSVLSRER